MNYSNSNTDYNWNDSANESIIYLESEIFSENQKIGTEQLQLVEQLISETEGMSYSEAQEHMAEWASAILPILTQLLPSLIPMIPSAVQAVTSLFQGGGGNNAPRQAAPAPARTPAPLPVPVQNQGGDLSQTLSALTGLLQNPQVMAMLTNLAAGGRQSSVQSNTGASVPTNAILSSVGTLANQAAQSGARRESAFAQSEIEALNLAEMFI